MHWSWEQICADPSLAALPYRVESDPWGSVILRPPLGVAQSYRKIRIAALLDRLLAGGKSSLNSPLRTIRGVKIVDATWISDERSTRQVCRGRVAALAPEICVEICSRGQQAGEIQARKQLYFQKGATECWVCEMGGKLSFYAVDGQTSRSRLCPDFPVELPTSTLTA